MFFFEQAVEQIKEDTTTLLTHLKTNFYRLPDKYILVVVRPRIFFLLLT